MVRRSCVGYQHHVLCESSKIIISLNELGSTFLLPLWLLNRSELLLHRKSYFNKNKTREWLTLDRAQRYCSASWSDYYFSLETEDFKRNSDGSFCAKFFSFGIAFEILNVYSIWQHCSSTHHCDSLFNLAAMGNQGTNDKIE